MKKVFYEKYCPKSVLNVHKHVDGGWFWSKYSAYPYMGCYYGCEYCYWRDEKYNRLLKDPKAKGLDDPFSQYIKIKENAVELLRKELSKKSRDIIYVDSYQPIEAKHRLARRMLEVCYEMNFPVFINEKSPMILNDLDVLKKIRSKSFLNVGFSIVFSKDDESKKAFEYYAPSINSRFKAMKELSKNKILTGTVMMPILPFICDSEENIKEIIRKTKSAGGSYVLDAGLTLRGYCDSHYYKVLKGYDESLVNKYKRLYFEPKNVGEHYSKIHELVKEYCRKYGLTNHIPREVGFYPEEVQLNKKVAEQFFNKSREIMCSEGPGYHHFAYFKAGYLIDEMKSNISEVYDKGGKKALTEIKGIGDKTADEIVRILKRME